jgi:hypothetical protein
LPRSDRHHMTLRLLWPVRKAVEEEARRREISVNDLINETMAKKLKVPFEARGGRRTNAFEARDGTNIAA